MAATVVVVPRLVSLFETSLVSDLQQALKRRWILGLVLVGRRPQAEVPWSLRYATVPVSAERVEGGLEEDRVHRQETRL